MPVPPQPPANPYGVIAGGASILGAAGQFSIRPGSEVKVGRDPAQCPVLLNEPRVSGVHATLKFEGGNLWVRDESSNNGVYVDGARIAAATWTPVGASSALRFGPIDFAVRLDP
jgi:pSer/pThr/pTyr-binding forkhead associated (FHA) protein